MSGPALTNGENRRRIAVSCAAALALLAAAGPSAARPDRAGVASIAIDCADAHYADVRDDPDDDAVGGAPEIVWLTICNDVNAQLLFRVMSANRAAVWVGDTVEVFVDADKNPATGAPSVDGVPAGADVRLHGDASGGSLQAGLSRWQSAWVAEPVPTLAVDELPSGLTFRLPAAALGTTSFFVSMLTSYTAPSGARGTDSAPQDRWRYDVITTGPPTGPPPPGPPPDVSTPPDIDPPGVSVLQTTTRRGKVVRFRYRVVDRAPTPRGTVVDNPDSPTRELATLYRGNRVIRTWRTPMRLGGWRTVGWRAPRKRRILNFCVQAWDQQGNPSTVVCARVRVR